MHTHNHNATERAIQSFKNHFILGLYSTDPKYQSQEWDRLLPQATMTLNLLRTSRTNPELSSYAAIFSIHDFNRCPLVPPGIKLIVHENTDNRWYWYPHGTDGCYIGPSMEHYRRVQCFMPDTSSLRNVDTLTFFPDAIPHPKMETEDYVQQSVGNILAIPSKPKTQLPFLTCGDTTESTV